MIPKLIPNEEFYNTISTGNRQYFRNMEEPYGTMGFNWKWFVFLNYLCIHSVDGRCINYSS